MQGDVELLAASYGDDPPNVQGRRVYIVDFSYKRQTLFEMLINGKPEHITLIDHHKTAIEDLEGFEHRDLTLVLNPGYSGAVLTWMHMTRITGNCWMLPRVLEHIQDRDLWQFKLPATREMLLALGSYEQSLAVWDELIMQRPITSLVEEGVTLLRKYNRDLRDLVMQTRQRGIIGEYDVPVANVPGMYASDAGNIMSQFEPFAATYYDTAEGRKFSLRSQKDKGLDVAAICQQYGGGGHKNAAGFFVKWNPSNPLCNGSFLCNPVMDHE
jgi:oligoribonuclease NrnB/cAMP/cGMP phosphodiesterase (DHH superfamily)